ncbi:hypothetical protein ABZ154_13715 [Streptomyces sp. NPDC006261]
MKSNENITCGHCAAPLEQKEGRGRLRRFCSQHHGRMYRSRMRAMGFDV